MKSCCILAGGPINDYTYMKRVIEEDDFIICADGGMKHLEELNKKPDILLGDFDSCSKVLFDKWSKKVPIHVFPTKKDSTDTELALDYAIENRYKRIKIFGGTGARMDHTLANIHILVKALKSHCQCTIIDECNKILVIDDEIEIKKDFGTYVSLIPLTSQVKGVKTKGLEYPLDGVDMIIGSSIGVSNKIINKEAAIALKEGIMIVIQSRDE